MPEPDFATSTRWLTCLTIDSRQVGINRDVVIHALEKHNIESRPTWKPMHMQPLYKGCDVVGGSVAEYLFKSGLCLPSGTGMTEEDQARIISVILDCWPK